MHEYVKITKAGENHPETEAKQVVDDVLFLVDDGQIKKAAQLIEFSENDDIKSSQELQEWQTLVRSFDAFYQAIRNVALYSLAEMRVNNIKSKE